MDQIGWIRRLHRREHKSEREIARITGLSRNTVAKWLHGELVEPKYRRIGRPNKLAPYHEALQQTLATDAHRPKHERRTAKVLYAQIKARGYEGGYTRVTDYIRRWRVSAGAASNLAFVPLAFELGEAYQFDWSEEGLMVGGIYYRAQVAHMKLCASRAFWLVAYPSQGHEMLFDAHNRAFAALGGVARRGIYDNMKTAVDRVKKGKGREVNARFAAMCAHFLIDAEFCNVAAGWEKGVVEKNVQDSRRRIWQGRCSSDAGAASPNSTRGSVSAASNCGANCAIPSKRASAWPRCSSSSANTCWPCKPRSTATCTSSRGCRAPAWCRWRATAIRCRASWPARR